MNIAMDYISTVKLIFIESGIHLKTILVVPSCKTITLWILATIHEHFKSAFSMILHKLKFEIKDACFNWTSEKSNAFLRFFRWIF